MEVKAAPSAVLVSPAKPEPSHPQGKTGVFEVPYIEAAKRDGLAYPSSVDVAIAPIGRCAALPKESPLNFFHEFEGFLRGRKDEHLVDGDCIEDGFDQH